MIQVQATSGATRFQRFILPGFAFKAVVIGGGYATGREIATFFLPSGPAGGVLAILLATAIWSIVATLTFLFAFDSGSRDYRSFFRALLGPFSPLFELVYLLMLVLVLAVFASAAGAVANHGFAAPEIAGTLAFTLGVVLVASFGNASVEALFKYVTIFLYGTYAVFFVLFFMRFGDRIHSAFSSAAPMHAWVQGGVTYAGYNIVGAVIVLSTTRHFVTRRDAVVAGMLAGPMAMTPALLFFAAMTAFYPDVMHEALPSDFLLRQLDIPILRLVFDAMIFSALLESATGAVHALNERLAASYAARRSGGVPTWFRPAVTIALLAFSVLLAGRFGLIELIANGYPWLAAAILLIYVVPLLTLGVWRIWRRSLDGRTATIVQTTDLAK